MNTATEISNIRKLLKRNFKNSTLSSVLLVCSGKESTPNLSILSEGLSDDMPPLEKKT